MFNLIQKQTKLSSLTLLVFLGCLSPSQATIKNTPHPNLVQIAVEQSSETSPPYESPLDLTEKVKESLKKVLDNKPTLNSKESKLISYQINEAKLKSLPNLNLISEQLEQSSQLFTYGTHWEFLPRENPKALSKIPTQFKQNNVTFLYLASNCSLCGFVKETLNSLEKTKGDNPNYALLKDKLFQTTPLAYPSDVKSAEKGLERRRKGNFKHNVVELLESGNDDEATDYFLSTTMFDYVLDNVFPNKKWEMLSNVFSEMNDRGLNIRDTQQLLDFYKKHLDTKKGQTLENTILPIYNDLPQTTEMALWALEIYDFLKTDYTKPSILVDNRYRINYQQIYNSFFNGDQFLIDLVNFLALLSYLEDNEVITNIKS